MILTLGKTKINAQKRMSTKYPPSCYFEVSTSNPYDGSSSKKAGARSDSL